MSALPSMRRGWCPDMLRPMPTGDGLLVRVHPRGSILSANQARAVAEGAAEFGNGWLDVSSRGNIQIRGVSATSHPHLVEALLMMGLMDGVRAEAPYRLTTISPLAGIDPSERLDAFALAESLEKLGHSATGLHPKLSILVDGSGVIGLDTIEADLRLVALSATHASIGIGRPNGYRWCGPVAVDHLPALVGTLLSHSGAARLRDMSLSNLLIGFALEENDAPPARPAAPRAGSIHMAGLSAFILGLPYGRCSAAALAEAASWSETFGAGEIRLSPFRGLVILLRGESTEIEQQAAAQGFITDSSDPRLSVNACVGKDGCTRGTTHTHRDADSIAAAMPAGLSVHVSGCPKGCAHPGRAELTLVGDAGAYEVVLEGTARDKPEGRAGIDHIVKRLAAVSSRNGLVSAFKTTIP